MANGQGEPMTNQERIVKLTKAWYEVVSVDHHKDRDCHWTIEIRYSYGQAPVYDIVHEGYVWDRVRESCSTLKGAEETLLCILNKALKRERDRAKEILKQSDEGWDRDEARKVLVITEFLETK
jgi:hypothetical protein